MSKCKGCGVKLQYEDETKLGFTPKKDGKLCQRCFKITNYNEHVQVIDKIDNEDIIKGINSKKGATLFLCDILSLNKNVMSWYNKINNPKCLVITKSDIIPKNIKYNKLAKKIMDVYNVEDLIFASSLNGEGKNDIISYLKDYDKVIFAGPTSSGKSSLINYLFNLKLTVSNRKNTTQEFINIKNEYGQVYDAPGFNEEYLEDSIKVAGYINPRTISLKPGYELHIGKLIISSEKETNITLFLPKDVIISSKKCVNKLEKEISVDSQCDLIIDNIGFIYFKNEANIECNDDCYLDIRQSIVGDVHE